MSDKAAKMISAGLFALALSYFITNVREVYPLDSSMYLKINHLTGSLYWCTTMFRECDDASNYKHGSDKSE